MALPEAIEERLHTFEQYWLKMKDISRYANLPIPQAANPHVPPVANPDANPEAVQRAAIVRAACKLARISPSAAFIEEHLANVMNLEADPEKAYYSLYMLYNGEQIVRESQQMRDYMATLPEQGREQVRHERADDPINYLILGGYCAEQLSKVTKKMMANDQLTLQSSLGNQVSGDFVEANQPRDFKFNVNESKIADMNAADFSANLNDIADDVFTLENSWKIMNSLTRRSNSDEFIQMRNKLLEVVNYTNMHTGSMPEKIDVLQLRNDFLELSNMAHAYIDHAENTTLSSFSNKDARQKKVLATKRLLEKINAYIPTLEKASSNLINQNLCEYEAYYVANRVVSYEAAEEYTKNALTNVDASHFENVLWENGISPKSTEDISQLGKTSDKLYKDLFLRCMLTNAQKDSRFSEDFRYAILRSQRDELYKRFDIMPSFKKFKEDLKTVNEFMKVAHSSDLSAKLGKDIWAEYTSMEGTFRANSSTIWNEEKMSEPLQEEKNPDTQNSIDHPAVKHIQPNNDEFAAPTM